jgi:hypothetical protein
MGILDKKVMLITGTCTGGDQSRAFPDPGPTR